MTIYTVNAADDVTEFITTAQVIPTAYN